ncbi:WD domain, G-beta repeat [Novymonas esmeraldas]|uniref:WD domain, G-beta repeat n=1 Tax=Novymonas esmeraldas TaxID=1808958 RepID=A0AAW0ESR5_9TRYP
MLSKKKEIKRAAISAVARKERQAHQRPQTTHARTSATATHTATASASVGEKDDVAATHSRPALSSADALHAGSGAGHRTDMIRKLGDHINTRLQEVTFEDDLDGDVFHERRAQLMEEARLAAGLKQRDVSTSVRQYLGHQTALRDLHSVRIAHNCNSITCVAALGTDRIVYGDKSGKVYLVDMSLATSGAGVAVADAAELQRRRKALLEPVLPSGVVCIAVSDTRANRPTTRDIYEKTSVDTSCPSYVAAGAVDGSISVWETLTKAHKGLLFMHRKPITGLCFRMDTATLYSGCEDGTLRVWAVPQMIATDRLFGHEGPIHVLDCLRKETAATVSQDGTMRFWKMDAATQQAYTYAPARRPEAATSSSPSTSAAPPPPPPNVVMEAVAMLNESIIVGGAMDGSVVVFDVNRRKPLVVVPAAHGYGFIGDGTGLEKAAAALLAEEDVDERGTRGGAPPPHASSSSGLHEPRHRSNPNPITAVAAVPYADVVATASYDGVVRVWHVVGVGAGATAPGRRTEEAAGNGGSDAAPTRGRGPQLVLVAELPVPAIVNALRFSDGGDVLFVAMAKEPRRGRWVVQSSARNGVLVVPLTEAGRKTLRGVSGEVEHIPAQLFGVRDAEDSGADEAEGGASEEEEAEPEREEDDGLEREDDDDGVADMFDVGPDGMLRFNAGAAAQTSTGTRAGKKTTLKKAKGGIPKVLRRGAGLADASVQPSGDAGARTVTTTTKKMKKKAKTLSSRKLTATATTPKKSLSSPSKKKKASKRAKA